MLKPESKSVYTNIFLTYFILQCRSTFLKQMKFIHGQRFKIEEKRRLIPFINQQIISIIQCICRAMQTLCIPFENPQNEVRYAFK
jgi:hypothetical protein